MHINKALNDRILNAPSINDNATMMYRKLISLIDQYNTLAEAKGLATKNIPVYGNNMNCAMMSRLIGGLVKDINRLGVIEEDTLKEKILTGMEFTDDGTFSDGIWKYTIQDDNTINVGLNPEADPNTFPGDSITLDYDHMPYEKLIDADGKEYLTVSYEELFYGLPSSIKSLTIDNWPNRNVKNMTGMFSFCSDLTSLTLGDNFNTSIVTDMQSMFYGCSGLPTLTLGDNFNTANVEDMSYMFNDCAALTSLTLDKFDTSNVENMASMFNGCFDLTTLTLGDKFNTAKVEDMSHMFYLCTALKSLTLGDNFNTSIVTDMQSMFHGCSALTSLTLSSSVNTAKVEDMSHMFDGCSSLTSLKLSSNFNTSIVTDMLYMFKDCSALTSVTLYQDASSIVKGLPAATWNITNANSSPVGTVDISQGISVNWGEGVFDQWADNVPWTLSRTI